MKILLVDDDRDLVDLLSFALHRAGMQPLVAFDVPMAMKVFRDGHPDLAVLDVNLGEASGFDLLKDLRHHADIPVIMLTARASEDDKVKGFDLGADDYLTKPFSHRELVARIRARLRPRKEEWAPPPPEVASFEVGDVKMNVREHTVHKGSELVPLSVTEFRLLHNLMTNAGIAVPTRVILKQVWGYDDPDGTDLVRVTIYRLRRKLEDDPVHPRLVHTVSGVGFMMKA